MLPGLAGPLEEREALWGALQCFEEAGILSLSTLCLILNSLTERHYLQCGKLSRIGYSHSITSYAQVIIALAFP